MSNEVVKGRGGLWRMVEVGGILLAGGAFVVFDLHKPPPSSTNLHHADIHSEYVKFPSGRDTITAYLAYPERKDPAPGVMGFCWGGGQSFRYATNNPSLGAFVVCYGPSPEPTSIARIRAKGLGVYAENDARINAGLADVDAAIRTYHKTFRHTVYPGVGHGFLRAREKPEVADSAWKAVVGFFKESLEH